MTPTLKTANEIALEALDEQLDRHAVGATLGKRATVTDDGAEEPTDGTAISVPIPPNMALWPLWICSTSNGPI